MTNTRASRFPLRLPLRYRHVGDPEWQKGKTENISDSGVLFRVEGALQVDTTVELRLVLPPAVSEGAYPEVVCRGRVVRTIPPANDQATPGLVVRIEHYNFVRPSLSH